MATITSTSFAVTNTISANPLLAAFATSYGGGFARWSGTALTYTSNIGDANPDGQPTGTWTNELTQAIELAHADVAAISNLTFTEVPNVINGSDGADIDYWYYREVNGPFSGYSYGIAGNGVFLNEDSVYREDATTGNGLAYGGLNYRTVIHEILHNLGFSHPHDGYANLPGVSSSNGDTGDFALNQNLYTVLSYNRVNQVDANGAETTGHPFTFSTVDRSFGVMGTLDIAAIQAVYGENATTATGDDIYELPGTNDTATHYKAIWDAGGTDEFRYSGSRDVHIDLRAATLDIADGMLAGGILSRADGIYGGYNIANGTLIENATGGDGDDLIRGNDAANLLTGNAGADTVEGDAGADAILGGAGADSLAGGAGNDTLSGGTGNDTLDGGGNHDVLSGGSGDDNITGGSGRDTIVGGQGADTMDGGGNDDWLSYETSPDAVSVDLEAQSGSGGDATGDIFSGFANLIGSDGADILSGDEHGNTLLGGAGNDRLNGGSGDDALQGDPGDDVLNGGAGGDTLIGGAGDDTLDGGNGADHLLGGDGHDTFLFNAGADTIDGGICRDIAIFDGFWAAFHIIDQSKGNWLVTEISSGVTDTLISIETLQFDDLAIV